MDESTIENIRYKFELKKLIGDEALSSVATKTEIRSDPWEDDLDLLSSTPNPELQDDNPDKDLSYSALYSKENDEVKLLEESVDLYNDLMKIEEEEQKSKQIHEKEFENCKKDLEKFKESDAKNKTRIEELTRENCNLKRSLSSLYRTAKMEIEFKDKSLEEANSEILKWKNVAFLKHGGILKNEKCPNCNNNISDSKKDANTSKRKRPESPEQSKKRLCKSSETQTYETDLQSEKSKRKPENWPEDAIINNNYGADLIKNRNKENASHRQISKDVMHNKETQISYQCFFCQLNPNTTETENSKDSREVTDMRFNLLPDYLKKSFYDSVNSLNKLKEAFINEIFHSNATASSSVLESTSKGQDIINTEELVLTKNSDNTSSSKTILIPNCENSELSEKETKKDCLQNHVSEVPKNCSSSSLNEKEEVPLNKTSECVSSRMQSTPTSSSVQCKRTELARKFNEYKLEKNEAKKDYAEKCVSKVPKNCYNSRQNKRKELNLDKSFESASSRKQSTSSSEQYKRTDISRTLKKDELNRDEAKKHHSQNHVSKKPSKNYNSRQDKKDLINLFTYRNEKIPFEEKKKYGLHKDDQKLIPEKLL